MTLLSEFLRHHTRAAVVLSDEAHTVDRRQMRRNALPRVALVLRNPGRAYGRAECQSISGVVNIQAVAIEYGAEDLPYDPGHSDPPSALEFNVQRSMLKVRNELNVEPGTLNILSP